MADEQELFAWLGQTSPASAEVIVPLLIDAVQPTSVLDVGCGDGSWLTVFAAHGVSDSLGVDTADPALVALPDVPYRQVDLNRPFEAPRRFDLAVCLEVGEHLTVDAAPHLVAALVGAAPVIAFSAAIPGQGGIGHVNEQWPDWWRAQFDAHDYRRHDVLRGALWADDRVAFWYAQNMFLYAEPGWEPRVAASAPLPDRVVHPDLLAQVRQPPGLRRQLREIPASVRSALRRRMG